MLAFLTVMTSASLLGSENAPEVLKGIVGEVAVCRLCQLAETRTNTVPGEGSPSSEVMFIGEGPGRDEDVSGRPFVGRAGQFLDELIESIPMRRTDVYIANAVKCRPPGNRNPEKSEIEACSPYLRRQIETIDPLVIATLGGFALSWFFPDRRITQSHGQLLAYEGRVVLPLFHPASGLRNPQHADSLREDVRKIPEAMIEAIRLKLESSEPGEQITPTELEAAPSEVTPVAVPVDKTSVRSMDDGPTPTAVVAEADESPDEELQQSFF